MQGMGKTLVRSQGRGRQGLRKESARFAQDSCDMGMRVFLRTGYAASHRLLRHRIGRGRPQAPAVSRWARPVPGSCGAASGSVSSQLPLRPSLIVIPEVGVENAAVIGNRHAGPVAMVVEPVPIIGVLEPGEEASIAEIGDGSVAC